MHALKVSAERSRTYINVETLHRYTYEGILKHKPQVCAEGRKHPLMDNVCEED